MKLEQQNKYSLQEVCSMTGVNRRKLRYYIDRGLIDRPEGPKGNGAFYTEKHVDQLLETRQWKDAGLSLERIQGIVKGVVKNQKGSGLTLPPLKSKKTGDVDIWNRVYISDGIELNINTHQSGLRIEEINNLVKVITEYFQNNKIQKTHT